MKITNLKQTVLIAISCLTINTSAVELSLSALYGNDSNPHRLTDSFSPLSDSYLYTDLKLKGETDKMYYFNLNYKGASYQDDTNSDWSKSKIGLAFRSKLQNKKIRYKASINFNNLNSTYVSRFTGQLAEFATYNLGDRYDAKMYNFNASVDYKLDNKAKLGLSYQRRDKNYQSYNIDGVSNLDYTHNRIGINFNYPISKFNKLSINSGLTKRNYDNRRAKDLTGLDIDGTDLSYNIFDVKGTLSLNNSKTNSWKIAAKYSQRTDNEAGYWDSKSNYLSVSNKKTINQDHIIESKLKYSVFSYDSRVDVVGVDLDEQAKENSGFAFSLDYRWIFNRSNEWEVSAYAKLEVDSFTSSTIEYKYQRNQVALGVRLDYK